MRTREEIINDLKVLWGEDWEQTMAIVSDYQFHGGEIEIPLSKITKSNNLVWELGDCGGC